VPSPASEQQRDGRMTGSRGLVHYSVTEGVATVTLDDPGHLNAISPELTAQLNTALERAIADPAARVIVLQGAGKAFSCAG
jgi:enoyl-CoA hydratase/carnithine racemase